MDIIDARKKSEEMRETLLNKLAERKQKTYDLGDSQVLGNIKVMRNAKGMRKKLWHLGTPNILETQQAAPFTYPKDMHQFKKCGTHSR